MTECLDAWLGLVACVGVTELLDLDADCAGLEPVFALAEAEVFVLTEAGLVDDAVAVGLDADAVAFGRDELLEPDAVEAADDDAVRPVLTSTWAASRADLLTRALLAT